MSAPANNRGDGAGAGEEAAKCQSSTNLAAEIQVTLASHPDLGINGFLCRFTRSSASFPRDRDAAFQPAFVQHVASILEFFTQWQPGICYAKSGQEYAEMCASAMTSKAPVGAVIVALHIANVRVKRIYGSADVSIVRLRRS